MILEPHQYARVIGVDVASKKLDVYDSAGKLKKIVVNDELEIAQAIASKIMNPTETLVVCEGTGGYEDHLVDVMHDHGINVAVVNPRQVRDFAKGHGVTRTVALLVGVPKPVAFSTWRRYQQANTTQG